VPSGHEETQFPAGVAYLPVSAHTVHWVDEEIQSEHCFESHAARRPVSFAVPIIGGNDDTLTLTSPVN
jgi:hypothetical protein